MIICRRIQILILIQIFFLGKAFSKELILIEETNLKKVSSIFILSKNDSILKRAYDSIRILKSNKKFPEALRKAQFLLKKSQVEDNIEIEFLTYYLMADIFYKTNNLNKALEYFKKSERIKLFSNKESINSNSLPNTDYVKVILKIGSTYLRLQKYDSAKFYYKKLENINSLNDELLSLQAISFTNISGIYEKDSLFKEAKEYATKAINVHKKRNNKVSQAAATINLANVYSSEKKYSRAKEIYFEALELIEYNNSGLAIKHKADLYFNLAWAMRNLKDYKAYDFQEMSYEIEDDLREKEFRGIIAEINEKYDFDVKKNLLLKEEENKRLRDQRTFWIIGIGGLVVILSLLYWLNFYKLKQKNLALELTQTQLIQNQKIERLKSDSQTRILNATIDGKESERKQIAETLHDSVSALLSSAKLHLQATKGQFNGKTPIEIEKTSEIITEASHKIRDLSHTLVSSVLLKFGLEFAIKDMAKKYSNSQIEFDVDISKVRRYHQNFEIKMYNIIQEFLNNILKHSKASKATITLNEEQDKLHLEIVDNGVGFDKTKITQKDGLGINQIDARIKVMNGYFFIDSSKNNGTKIVVELPVIEKQKANLV